MEVEHPEMQNIQFLHKSKKIIFLKYGIKKVLWQRLSEERVFTFNGTRLGSQYFV